MSLNPDKSDTILLGTRQRSSCYTSLDYVEVALLLSPFDLPAHIKVLGVTLYSHLSFVKHINFNSICKFAFYRMSSISLHLTFYFVSAIMFYMYIHWIYVFLFLLFMFFMYKLL